MQRTTLRAKRMCAKETSNREERAVVSRSPQSNNRAQRGSTLQITNGKAPATTTVPDLTGLGIGEAKDLLSGAGLSLGGQDEAYSDSIAAGLVLSQGSTAGTELDKGASVDVTVSLGPEPVAAPTPTPTPIPVPAPAQPESPEPGSAPELVPAPGLNDLTSEPAQLPAPATEPAPVPAQGPATEPAPETTPQQEQGELTQQTPPVQDPVQVPEQQPENEPAAQQASSQTPEQPSSEPAASDAGPDESDTLVPVIPEPVDPIVPDTFSN